MNSKRMRFSVLVLAVYVVLGVVGAFSQSSISGDLIGVGQLSKSDTPVEHSRSNSGGEASAEHSLQWHSFLPGAFL